jgi:hypothetical protein
MKKTRKLMSLSTIIAGKKGYKINRKLNRIPLSRKVFDILSIKTLKG